MPNNPSPPEDLPAGVASAAAPLPVPGAAGFSGRLRDFVLVAAWLGLLVGITESVTTKVLLGVHNAPLVNASAAVWMAPTSLAVLFAMAGGLLWCVPRKLRRRLGLRTTLFLCGCPVLALWIYTLCKVFLVALWLPALLLLAAGLALQAARIAARHPAGFRRLVGRSTVLLVLLDVVLIVATQAGQWLQERWAVAHLPPAAPGAPNVLLLVLDTVRAKSMSLYGYPGQTTPNIDRWAGKGVVFERAMSTCSWTAPSHGSMFTGRDARQLSIDWNSPLDRSDPTLAEIFAAHGYLTGGVVSNVSCVGRHTGLQRGFVHYDANRVTLNDMVGSSSLGKLLSPMPTLAGADTINQRFLDWLPADLDRPYFAFLNYLDCHDPYLPRPMGFPFSDPERPYTGLECKRLMRLFATSLMQPKLPPDDFALAEDAYNGCLHELDRAVDEMLRALERRGQLDNTLVIIVSDHGEQFGEHGMFGHGNSLYRTLLHVPLVIFGPKVPSAGKRIPQVVSLRDLPATILALAGLTADGMHGESFAGSLRGEPPQSAPQTPFFAHLSQGTNFPDWFPNGPGPVDAVLTDGKHYIATDQREELFDIDGDRAERHDLIHSEPQAALVEKCRRLLSGHEGRGE